MLLTRFEALGLLPDQKRLPAYRPDYAGHSDCLLKMEEAITAWPDFGFLLCLWKDKPELGPMIRVMRADGPWYFKADPKKLERMEKREGCKLFVNRT